MCLGNLVVPNMSECCVHHDFCVTLPLAKEGSPALPSLLVVCAGK
jgi:hypothetical protein